MENIKDENGNIDFEEIFKNTQKAEPQKPKPLPYILSIIAYFAREIVGLLLVAVLVLIPGTTKDYSESEFSLRTAYTDSMGIAILDDISFLDEYESGLMHIGTYHGFEVVINSLLYETVFKDLENDNAALAKFIETLLTENTNYHIYIPKSIDDSYFTFTDKTIKIEPAREFTGLGFGVFSIIAMIIVAIPISIFLRKDLKEDLLKSTKDKIPFIRNVLIGFAIAFAGSLVAGYLSTILSTILGGGSSSENQLTISLYSIGIGAPLMAITAILLAPIVEELVFRKAIFSLFRNQNTGLAVSAIAFGIIHVTTELLTGDFLNFFILSISYIATGFVFGFIYLKSNKNIMVSILVHALYNTMAFIISLLL